MSKRHNQWIAFIDGERGDLLDMAKKENKLVDEADEQYNVLTGDAEVKRLAEIRLLSAMEEHSALESARQEGIEEGVEKGIKEGVEKGKKQEVREIAKKLKNMDMNMEFIMKVTGLSQKEIENIM